MYRSLATRGTLAAILATALAAVACSNGGQAMTPVTPTALSASQVASTSGDESHGGGNQGGGDRGRNPGPGENDNEPNDDEVKGAIVAGTLSGSCAGASLVFRIGTTAIRTNPQTRFDGITCGALGAGDAIEVHGTPQADGSLLASRIESDE
jgi:hypothetical protein